MIKYMNSAGKEEKILAEEYRRHDISDRMWKLLKPHLMEREPEEEMKILDAQKGAKFKNPPFSG